MTRPNPGCVPISKKNGPTISSSRKPSLSKINVTEMSRISTPATSAASSAANAISSLVVHSLPWNSGYTLGSLLWIVCAMPMYAACLAWISAVVGCSLSAMPCAHSSGRANWFTTVWA